MTSRLGFPDLSRFVGTSLPDLTDEELGKRFAALQRDAAEELLRHQAALYGRAYRILRNHADAEDVTQQALINAWRGLQGFKGGSTLKTWLSRVVDRAALNLLRRMGVFHARERGSGAAEVEYARLQQQKVIPTPTDELSERELPEVIERILVGVPELQCRVYAMRCKGQKVPQIAHKLELRVKEIKLALEQVLDTLREELTRLGWSVL